MSKSHIIKLKIVNQTKFPFKYGNNWFDTGRLADRNSWPITIKPSQSVEIMCYEKDWSLVGCSASVQYLINDINVFFTFSNPTTGDNGIGIGTDYNTWDTMKGQYTPVERVVKLKDNISIIATISSTPSDTNNATWIIRDYVG